MDTSRTARAVLFCYWLGLLLAPLAVTKPALAEENTEVREPDRYQVRFQLTNIWQGYPSFSAANSGEGSFPTRGRTRETLTATAFLGLRLFGGTEVWLNPEMAQGFGLNRTFGIAAFPNGDASKAGSAWPREYMARAFVRQTINLDSDREWVDTETNALGGHYSSRRLVFTFGKMAVGDIFSDNRYSHDPRTQFMNWSIMEAGAWDFASDARQYTWGLATELILPGRALRYGVYVMPTRYNPPENSWRGFGSLHHVAELEQQYELSGRPGTVRLLGFYTRANMARFRDVLASPLPAVEALPALRRFYTPKLGAALSLEQEVQPGLGVFGRVSWDDGRAEDLSFTQIDRSVAAGASLSGQHWGRPEDTFGIAASLNALSRPHRAVLAAGATGLIIGEGIPFRYTLEKVGEAYYSLATGISGFFLSLNYQFIANPAYNRDRGPASFLGARIRFAFGT